MSEFVNKTPKEDIKVGFVLFLLFGSLLTGSLVYFTYIRNNPILPSDYPIISIKSDEEINQYEYVNSSFSIDSESFSDIIEPINCKIKMSAGGSFRWPKKDIG